MKLPLITVEALHVLDTIDQRGSYAAAAEVLNKVPSALSYIVQKLEEQLNVTIFQRQGRRSVLTPAGKHLLDEGRKVLHAVDALSVQTQTIANGWEPKISIAFDSIIDMKVVFKGVRSFLDEHENIEIDIQEEVMNGSWEALIEDKVDLVIGALSPVPHQKGIRAIKIGQLDNVLVAYKTHDLLNLNRPIHLSELSKYRTVVVHDSARHEIARSVNVIEQSQHFYVTSIAQKIEAINAGIGVGFLPKDHIQPYLANGDLVPIELETNENDIDKVLDKDLYMAWKLTNRGKGLQSLTTILNEAFIKQI